VDFSAYVTFFLLELSGFLYKTMLKLKNKTGK